MPQPRDDFALCPKALDVAAIDRVMDTQQLEGHFARATQIAGAVDLAVCAAANGRKNLIGTEGLWRRCDKCPVWNRGVPGRRGRLWTGVSASEPPIAEFQLAIDADQNFVAAR